MYVEVCRCWKLQAVEFVENCHDDCLRCQFCYKDMVKPTAGMILEYVASNDQRLWYAALQSRKAVRIIRVDPKSRLKLSKMKDVIFVVLVCPN